MFTQFELKDISKEHLKEAHNLLVACGQEMHQKLGINHWPPFETLDKFQQEMASKKVFGVFDHERMVATFNLSAEPRSYYSENLWCCKGNALYLGQLATLPILQGTGLGKWCLTQSEQITHHLNYNLLRFDTLKAHPRLESFYKKAGYHRCQSVIHNGLELICFEKKLEM